MVNSYLTYEALLRQQIHGRFDYIQAETNLAAAKNGWNPALIESLDSLFVSSKQ